MDDQLSDHDKLSRIYDALFEPDTGLKSLILKNTRALWGNGKDPGLVAKVQATELRSRKREKYIIAVAGGLGASIGEVIREVLTFLHILH